MKFLVLTAILAVLSFGENFGLTNGYTTSYKLKVVEDVTLERGTTNFNNLKYLIAGFHIEYPKKRSLLRFENVPSGCKSVSDATMYIYIMCIHTRPVPILMLKLHSSLAPYELTEC